MVTFDIDTDGGVSQDDITKLLEETLKSGNLDGYRVSPDGFDFVKIRGEYILYNLGLYARNPGLIPTK